MNNSLHFRMVTAEVLEVACSIKGQLRFATEFFDVIRVEYRPRFRIRHYVEEHWNVIRINDRSQHGEIFQRDLFETVKVLLEN